jgi:hypothetical protein
MEYHGWVCESSESGVRVNIELQLGVSSDLKGEHFSNPAFLLSCRGRSEKYELAGERALNKFMCVCESEGVGVDCCQFPFTSDVNAVRLRIYRL